MKNPLFFLLIAFFAIAFATLTTSCNKEEYNVVKLELVSYDPNAPVKVSHCFGSFTVKGNWSNEYNWDEVPRKSGMTAYCEDRNVLLRINIYVNGKLKNSKEGNYRIFAWVKE